MRKNTMMRLASIVLVLTLLSTCAISGTFAKYVSSVSGTDKARVALWEFEFGGENGTDLTETITFNAFNYTDASVDVNGLDNNAKVIAPGTTGTLNFQLENQSEVDAKYTITFTAKNDGNIPMLYSVDGGDTWKSDISEVQLDGFALMDGGVQTTGNFQWKWAFEDTTVADRNASDTNLGKEGTAELVITATIKVEQIDDRTGVPSVTP